MSDAPVSTGPGVDRGGPPYGRASLADLMPSLAGSLGVPAPDRPDPGWDLPPARRTVLVLVDGLGEQALLARSGHAPTLRRLLAETTSDAAGAPDVLEVGFPTTTATSLASLGTGLPPGRHGMVGTEVLDPERGQLFSELAWDRDVDPRRWQSHPTVFDALQAEGVDAVHVAPGIFDGSGLTTAALRGARFAAAQTLAQRVELTAHLIRSGDRVFALLYWEGLDKVGHVHGRLSAEWTTELERVDAAVGALLSSVPADVAVFVTGDHGMVDIGPADRLDLRAVPGLLDRVAHLGGEPRARYAYAVPGAAEEVLAAFESALGERCTVFTREQAVAAGWFGPVVEERVLPRLPDVLAVPHTDVALVDTARQRPESLALIGMHGALTAAESRVPLLRGFGSARPARRRR